jgi:ribosome-associated toxin RatA of RatAB toxin-antitoxin module
MMLMIVLEPHQILRMACINNQIPLMCTSSLYGFFALLDNSWRLHYDCKASCSGLLVLKYNRKFSTKYSLIDQSFEKRMEGTI